MPAGAVYVGRPSLWGNMCHIGMFSPSLGRRIETPEETVAEYQKLMEAFCARPDAREFIRKLLGGRDLVCWCPLDKPCHADVLLEIAN